MCVLYYSNQKKKKTREREKKLRMRNGIELQEMVFAAITSNLELGTETNDCTSLLGHGNGLLDLLQVAIEIHGPLVQITRCHLQQPHLLLCL